MLQEDKGRQAKLIFNAGITTLYSKLFKIFVNPTNWILTLQHPQSCKLTDFIFKELFIYERYDGRSVHYTQLCIFLTKPYNWLWITLQKIRVHQIGQIYGLYFKRVTLLSIQKVEKITVTFASLPHLQIFKIP